MKKEDKIWIPTVTVCDVVFLVSFFGILSGLWKIDLQNSSKEKPAAALRRGWLLSE